MAVQEKKPRSSTEERSLDKNKEKEQALLAVPSSTKNAGEKTRSELSSEKKAKQTPQQPIFILPIRKLQEVQHPFSPAEGNNSNQLDNRTKKYEKSKPSKQGKTSRKSRDVLIPPPRIESFSPQESDRSDVKLKFDSRLSSARTSLPSTVRTERVEGPQALNHASDEFQEMNKLNCGLKQNIDEGFNDSFNVSRNFSDPKIILLNNMAKADSGKSAGQETPKFVFTDSLQHSPLSKSKTSHMNPLNFVIKEFPSDPPQNIKTIKQIAYKNYGLLENDKFHPIKNADHQEALALVPNPLKRKSKSQPKLEQLSSIMSPKEFMNPFTFPNNQQNVKKKLAEYKIEGGPKYVIEGPSLPSSTKNKTDNRERVRTTKIQQEQDDEQKPQISSQKQVQVPVWPSKALAGASSDNFANDPDLSDISVKKSFSTLRIDDRYSIGDIFSLNQDSEPHKQQLKKGTRNESVFDFTKPKDGQAKVQTWNGMLTKADSSKKIPESTEAVQVNPDGQVRLSTCREQNEEEDDNNFEDLKIFTSFLRRGAWNYAKSPKVEEMAKRKAERDAKLAIGPTNAYLVHQPCHISEKADTESRTSKRGYSPKMYQEIFGDMSPYRLKSAQPQQPQPQQSQPQQSQPQQSQPQQPQPQKSQPPLLQNHNNVASLFRVEAPAKKPKALTFDEIKERVAAKKNNK